MSPLCDVLKNQQLEPRKNVDLKTLWSILCRPRVLPLGDHSILDVFLGPAAFPRPLEVPKPLSKWLIFNGFFHLLLLVST